MKLRKDDECAICAAPLPAGTTAEWDSEAKSVICQPCLAGPAGSSVALPPPIDVQLPPVSAADLPPAPTNDQPAEPPQIDHGIAGASARREFERRQAKREARIEEKWGTGRLGRIAKALSDDPQTTKAWKEGANGEEVLARSLSERLGEDAVLLHDRKVPRTRGNIDHLAIASSGVWVIDAKRYRGKVEKRDVGGFFKVDLRLFVAGRDQTKKVDGLAWQVEAVRVALDGADLPIHPVLSFVDAEWSFFAKPMRFGDVLVARPKKLAELIGEPGPLTGADVERIAVQLSQRLPAN